MTAEAARREEVRLASRAIFGNRHKLEVCAAIARGEQLFYVQGLSDATGIPTSTIRPIITAMLGVLLRETPQLGGPAARRYIERLDHPFWGAVSTLHQAVVGAADLSRAD
jgi:hypothetical protein